MRTFLPNASRHKFRTDFAILEDIKAGKITPNQGRTELQLLVAFEEGCLEGTWTSRGANELFEYLIEYRAREFGQRALRCDRSSFDSQRDLMLDFAYLDKLIQQIYLESFALTHMRQLMGTPKGMDIQVAAVSEPIVFHTSDCGIHQNRYAVGKCTCGASDKATIPAATL